MILCNKKCLPICDFCIYCIHEMIEIDGKYIKSGPIDCKIGNFNDEETCEDFHCFNVK